MRLLTLDDIDPHWADGPNPRWRQGAALGTPGGMTVPCHLVFLHHTVSLDTGDVAADVAGPCDTDQHNFGKVSYSWNYHPSTKTWVEVEGTHRGAHTINNAQQSLNGISFGIGVIGNFHPFQTVPPPEPVSEDLIVELAEGIHELLVLPGLVTADFVLNPHRKAPYATACCGDTLAARVDDIRALVDRPPVVLATSAQGGTVPTLFHPSHPNRADDFWIAPDRSVRQSWYVDGRWFPQLADGTQDPEGYRLDNPGEHGQALDVSASWRHDAAQLRVVVHGTDDHRYEKVYDVASNKWGNWTPIPGELHAA